MSARAGFVETLSIADSVVQGLPASDGTLLAADQVYDPDGLVSLLRHKRDSLTRWIATRLSSASKAAVSGHQDGTPVAGADLDALVADLNAIIQGPSIWKPKRFADRTLTAEARKDAAAGPTGDALVRLNRRLLDEAFGVELHDAAIAVADGLTQLVRTTLLGWGYVHRLECSESILDEPVIAGDAQDGCVRFSAWATGSLIPRKYESVRVASARTDLPHPPVRRVGVRPAVDRRRQRDPRRRHGGVPEHPLGQPQRIRDGRLLRAGSLDQGALAADQARRVPAGGPDRSADSDAAVRCGSRDEER